MLLFVVVYSAGIGRTGVFITIDIGISEIDNSNTVSIPNILSTIRQYRGGLVQTVQQYMFIYKVCTIINYYCLYYCYCCYYRLLPIIPRDINSN